MTDETDATWLTLAAAARNVVTFLTLGKEVRGLSCIGIPREPTGGCDRPLRRRNAEQAPEISATTSAVSRPDTDAAALSGETESNAESETEIAATASALGAVREPETVAFGGGGHAETGLTVMRPSEN